MRIRRTLAACAALAAFAAAPAQAAPFDILMRYTDGGAATTDWQGNARTTAAFTPRQVELLGMAETFWETVLTGFSGLAAPTITVTSALFPIDGRWRVAAYAGPRSIERVQGSDPTSGAARQFQRATTASMSFDADDFKAGGASEQTFLDTAIHELSHALGFGTLFSWNGLVDAANDRYIGREAVAAFNRTHGTALSGLPLDSGDGHWGECWVLSSTGHACAPEDGSGRQTLHNDDEILTPVLPGGASRLSAASIAAFRDLGYLTIDPASGIAIPSASRPAPPVPAPQVAPVPLPAGAILLVSALGCVAALRRRRVAAA